LGFFFFFFVFTILPPHLGAFLYFLPLISSLLKASHIY
jgi:hypothetical protein